MVTGWDMLPETAKALSAPITKLIEVVATGCGRLYEPSHIRRTAEAQGEALVILEEAKEQVSAIALRATQRSINVEVRRQTNIESIVAKAERQMPSSVSTTPVDADWAARVIQIFQDIGDDEMQNLWAKTLAGEVAQPGSFSLRTVHVLAQLSKPEALAFEALCTQALRVNGKPYPMVFSGDPAEINAIGLRTAPLSALEEAGLITRGEMGYSLRHDAGGAVAFAAGNDREVWVSNEKSEEATSLELQFYSSLQIPIGHYVFTGAGRELARFMDNTPTAHRIEFIVQKWEADRLSVQRYQCHVDEAGVQDRYSVDTFSSP